MCLPLKHKDTYGLAKGIYKNYEWEIVHNGHGYRCGYVRLLPDHPWYEKLNTSCADIGLYVSVHGGITFAEYGTPCPTHGPKAEWWVGFDCAHLGDRQDFSLPFDESHEKSRKILLAYDARVEKTYKGYTIKDTAYVEAECKRLIDQAEEAVL